MLVAWFSSQNQKRRRRRCCPRLGSTRLCRSEKYVERMGSNVPPSQESQRQPLFKPPKIFTMLALLPGGHECRQPKNLRRYYIKLCRRHVISKFARRVVGLPEALPSLVASLSPSRVLEAYPCWLPLTLWLPPSSLGLPSFLLFALPS